MKQPLFDLIKKIGEILINIAQIIFGVAVLAPFVKNETISIYPIISSIVLLMMGLFTYYKGSQNESI